MLSCLGIYVDRNLIKYAKVKKTSDSYKIETFNVEEYENLEESLERIINETNSAKSPISINISNELYNYFDVFSVLDKKDITKSLDIEFEMLCNDKKYDKNSLISRYILRDNPNDLDKYKAIYISTNKKEVDKFVKEFSKYRLYSMTPITTSITNLVDVKENENIAIINMENETKITTIVDGQINRVDVLSSGLESVIEKINRKELSWKKAYNFCKKVTISGDEITVLEEKEYAKLFAQALYDIASESKKIIGSFKNKIDKIYISGIGATINNVDLYFANFFKKQKCELLTPFFVESTSLKNPIKDYIEVNSAVALALNGLGLLNKDLNYAPNNKIDLKDFETVMNVKEELNFKEMLKAPLSIKEKMLVRGIAVCLIGIVSFSTIGGFLTRSINKEKVAINQKIVEINKKNEEVTNQKSKLKSYINTYNALINTTNSKETTMNQNSNIRVIKKDAIPNLLSKIMFLIPQEVQITSIKNKTENHIVIEAESKKYEQLGYFLAAIKNDGMLKNIKSTSGTKTDSIVQITIEGDLP